MKKLLLNSCLALSMFAGAAVAHEDVPAAPLTIEDQLPEVREYLLQNPEVIDAVIKELNARRAHDQFEQDKVNVAENADYLFKSPDSPVLGNPEGAFTLVKFSDYQCVHCRRVTPDLERFIAAHDDIRLIVKEFPILGERSEMAARFALAVNIMAGVEAYTQAQDAIFAMPTITPDALIALAEDLELDGPKVDEMMISERVTNELKQNIVLANTLKINGTPALIFKDVIARGGVPYKSMEGAYVELQAEAATPPAK